MADGIQGRDYLIAGIGGAVEGFFDNQTRENAEMKAQAQLERQAQLLMMKEERAAARDMRKQKDQQSFDLLKQDRTQTFELDKQDRDLKSKKEEAIEKRKLDLSDKADDRKWDVEKLGIQHDNAVKLKGMEEGKKSTDRTRNAQMKLRELIQTEKTNRKKDAFGAEGQAEPDLSWAETTYPELFAEAYPDGAPQTTGTRAPSGSKFGSIFQKVTGAASRTKQGANDSVEEPAPISVAPGGAVNELPAIGQNPSAGGPTVDTLQSLPSATPSTDATAAVEKAVTSNPKSVDIGQVLGLFAKGAVNVGSMSLEALKGLKWVLENTGDVSRSMTEPYKQLSAEVGQAMIDAGGDVVDTMTAPTTYQQKTSALNQSKVRYGGGNL